MNIQYLKGLNTLRFFAAAIVLIAHGDESLKKLDIYTHFLDTDLPVATLAVNFFFTLSGFLITYLLFTEIKNTSKVDIKKFYLRRIRRIWPLYFLIILIGFTILGLLVPLATKQHYFDAPISELLLLYVFFLPNLARSIYKVGMLGPLWSIGIEEQFYLFWAPLFRTIYKNFLIEISVVIILTFSVYYLLNAERNLFNFSPKIQDFVITLKFYQMAIGSIFSYILFYKFEWYKASIFTKKIPQLIVLVIVLLNNIIGFRLLPFEFPIQDFFMSFVYGLMILNVSAIPNKLIDLEKKPFVYLGKISFGIYMYHMTVNYLMRFVLEKFPYYPKNNFFMGCVYTVFLFAFTVLLAGISFKYFESFFMRKKGQLSS